MAGLFVLRGRHDTNTYLGIDTDTCQQPANMFRSFLKLHLMLHTRCSTIHRPASTWQPLQRPEFGVLLWWSGGV